MESSGIKQIISILLYACFHTVTLIIPFFLSVNFVVMKGARLTTREAEALYLAKKGRQHRQLQHGFPHTNVPYPGPGQVTCKGEGVIHIILIFSLSHTGSCKFSRQCGRMWGWWMEGHKQSYQWHRKHCIKLATTTHGTILSWSFLSELSLSFAFCIF